MNILLFGIKGVGVIFPLVFWASTLVFLLYVGWHIVTGKEVNEDAPFKAAAFQSLFLTISIGILAFRGMHGGEAVFASYVAVPMFVGLSICFTLAFYGLNHVILKIGHWVRKRF